MYNGQNGVDPSHNYMPRKQDERTQHTTPSPPFDISYGGPINGYKNGVYNSELVKRENQQQQEQWNNNRHIKLEATHDELASEPKKKKKKKKLKRVKKACAACRKSKVACSSGRPCKRCLKKGIPCIDEAVEKKVEEVLKDESQFTGRTTFKRKRSHKGQEPLDGEMEEEEDLEKKKMDTSYLETRYSVEGGKYPNNTRFRTELLPPLEAATTNTPLLSSAEYTKYYNEEQEKQGNGARYMDVDDDLVDMLDMSSGMNPPLFQNFSKLNEDEDSLFNQPLDAQGNDDEFLEQFTFQAMNMPDEDEDNNKDISDMMKDIVPHKKSKVNMHLSDKLSQLSLQLREHQNQVEMQQEMMELIKMSNMQKDQIQQAMGILNQQRNLIGILKRETGMLSLAPSPMISTAMYSLPPGLWDRYASNRNLGIFVFTRQGNLSLVGFNNTIMNVLKLHAHQLSHTNYTYSDMLKDVFRTAPTDEEMREKQKYISCYHGMAFPVRVTWRNLESVIKVVIRVHDEYLWWICLDFSLVLPPWDLKNSAFHKNAAKRCPKREAIEAFKKAKAAENTS